MKREWKPGDVAMVTGRDGEVLALRQDRQWASRSHLYFADWQIKDARPLVVIDPEDREQVERLSRLWASHAGEVDTIPQRLTTVLREFANPTPPKPEEPTGLGAVVEDCDGDRWVRATVDRNEGTGWRQDERALWAAYADIEAVRVLSEGVQP